MTLYFVQLASGNMNYENKVSTEGCADVADLNQHQRAETELAMEFEHPQSVVVEAE